MNSSLSTESIMNVVRVFLNLNALPGTLLNAELFHVRINKLSRTTHKCLIDNVHGNHRFGTSLRADIDINVKLMGSNNSSSGFSHCTSNHTRVMDKKVKEICTVKDAESLLSLLKEIIDFRSTKVSSWIIESKLKVLCRQYDCLSKADKNKFIEILAADYGTNQNQVHIAAKAFLDTEHDSELKLMKNQDQLRNVLVPQYSWLFIHIGRLEKGVKFLVDFRKDVLDLISEKKSLSGVLVQLQQLNVTLRELLSMWFSVGFLHLERVTWKSPCELLQKVSEYEAIHKVRNWTDLKRRVGRYRRCFVYLHGSMPGEPIVVLHTALAPEISSSMENIVPQKYSSLEDGSTVRSESEDRLEEEDAEKIKAAVFYSITSTQKGLGGIELGNHLIKRVVRELQSEFPEMQQFSSLSPVPTYRKWLLDRFKNAETGQNDLLFPDEVEKLEAHFGSKEVFELTRKSLASTHWNEEKFLDLIRVPLMRLCARYLYLEKRRGYALDSVANFHLKNGAVMWRMNWNADLTPKGLSNSFGIMVNYRYFLEETEARSRNYLEQQKISASREISELAAESKKLIIPTAKL